MAEVIKVRDLPPGFDGLAPCSVCGSTGVCEHLFGVRQNGEGQPTALRMVGGLEGARRAAAEIWVGLYRASLGQPQGQPVQAS